MAALANFYNIRLCRIYQYGVLLNDMLPDWFSSVLSTSIKPSKQHLKQKRLYFVAFTQT